MTASGVIEPSSGDTAVHETGSLTLSIDNHNQRVRRLKGTVKAMCRCGSGDE
jgi:hypothetical protein